MLDPFGIHALSELSIRKSSHVQSWHFQNRSRAKLICQPLQCFSLKFEPGFSRPLTTAQAQQGIAPLPAHATEHRDGAVHAAQHPIFRVLGVCQYKLPGLLRRAKVIGRELRQHRQVKAFADIAHIFTRNSQDLSLQ